MPFFNIDWKPGRDLNVSQKEKRKQLKNYYPEWSLNGFIDDGHLSEIIRVINGGKEGIVYCCRGGPMAGAELVAAKVYHPLQRRHFRHDVVYQESRLRGPKVRRERLAMSKKSNFGRKVQFGSWVGSEYETLRMLHDAGSDVPAPIAHAENVVLMEYVGDESRAAPPLEEVELPREEAIAIFERVLRNVGLWLDLDRIHGDLSAYNILYWNGAISIIDFPQAIDARFNTNARDLLERDLTNVCGYFERYGISSDSARIARRMWSAYRHGASLM